MKTLKVQTLQEGISRNTTMLDTLDGEIQSLKKSISTFAGLEEALKGKGGSAIRSFYEDCHIPLLDFIVKFSNEYKSTLEQVSTELDTLEPSNDGYIHQPFLDHELEQNLERIKQHTESLVTDANSTISSIGDIVSIMAIQDATFIQGIQSAKSEITETVDKLNDFDSSQSKSLSSAEEDLAMMDNWIKDIEGLMQDGKVDVDFPVEKWKTYAAFNPLTNKLSGKSPEFDSFTLKEGSNETEILPEELKAIGLQMKKIVDVVNDKTGDYKKISSWFKTFKTMDAGMKEGFEVVEKFNYKTGKMGFEIKANERALKVMGVVLDKEALRELNYKLPKGNKKLKDKHRVQKAKNRVKLRHISGEWTKAGKELVKKSPYFKYFNGGKNTKLENAKVIGKATALSFKSSFTDIVDFKGMAEPLKESGKGFLSKSKGILKSASKGLVPISAGISFFDNHQKAQADGYKGNDAVKAAAVDTAIDVSVSGAVQTAFTVAGTALIPIPGVGTAVGAGVGMVVNFVLSRRGKDKNGKEKDSVMDKIKGVKKWFK
ncbi:ribonuclease YeeF family protein [Rossellomorea marisflavi]|uniref:ribonuclease YeeF family protein n=1 Tax=Rossellomorea marisflavi TaxID=189381 RepID=UPI003D2EC42D